MPNWTQPEAIEMANGLVSWHLDKSRTTLYETRHARVVARNIVEELHFRNIDLNGISDVDEDNYGADYSVVVEPLLLVLSLRMPRLVDFLANQLRTADAKKPLI